MARFALRVTCGHRNGRLGGWTLRRAYSATVRPLLLTIYSYGYLAFGELAVYFSAKLERCSHTVAVICTLTLPCCQGSGTGLLSTEWLLILAWLCIPF